MGEVRCARITEKMLVSSRSRSSSLAFILAVNADAVACLLISTSTPMAFSHAAIHSAETPVFVASAAFTSSYCMR